MKTNDIFLASALIILAGLFILYPKILKTDKQNIFIDNPNFWQISYPSEVSTIRLFDEMGADAITSVIFERKDDGTILFEVGVSKTEFQDIDLFVGHIKEIGTELEFEKYTEVGGLKAVIMQRPGGLDGKNIFITKDEKLFSIYVSPNLDYDQIIAGFKFLNLR